jgi:hypothetical protein
MNPLMGSRIGQAIGSGGSARGPGSALADALSQNVPFTEYAPSGNQLKTYAMQDLEHAMGDKAPWTGHAGYGDQPRPMSGGVPKTYAVDAGASTPRPAWGGDMSQPPPPPQQPQMSRASMGMVNGDQANQLHQQDALLRAMQGMMGQQQMGR